MYRGCQCIFFRGSTLFFHFTEPHPSNLLGRHNHIRRSHPSGHSIVQRLHFYFTTSMTTFTNASPTIFIILSIHIFNKVHLRKMQAKIEL